MSYIKQKILHALDATGGTRLLRLANRKRPRILMYHRIIDQPFVAGLPPEQFDQQMAYLSKHYRVVPVEQLISELKSDTVKPYTISLTFDDGHFDFYTTTWPTLKKFNLPATLYLATGFVSNECWLWPDYLRYTLLHSKKESIHLPEYGVFSLSPDTVLETWSKLGDAGLKMNNQNRGQFLSELEKAADVTVPAAPEAPFTPVTWDQVREMHSEGLNVGSHTVSHPILSKLTQEEYALELGESYQRIAKELGSPTKGICYPNGMPKDINAQVVATAREIGYEYGLLACDTGLNINEPMLLGRLPAPKSADNLRLILSIPSFNKQAQVRALLK